MRSKMAPSLAHPCCEGSKDHDNLTVVFDSLVDAAGYMRAMHGRIFDARGRAADVIHERQRDTLPIEVQRRGTALAPFYQEFARQRKEGEELTQTHVMKCASQFTMSVVDTGTSAVACELGTMRWQDIGTQVDEAAVDDFDVDVPTAARKTRWVAGSRGDPGSVRGRGATERQCLEANLATNGTAAPFGVIAAPHVLDCPCGFAPLRLATWGVASLLAGLRIAPARWAEERHHSEKSANQAGNISLQETRGLLAGVAFLPRDVGLLVVPGCTWRVLARARWCVIVCVGRFLHEKLAHSAMEEVAVGRAVSVMMTLLGGESVRVFDLHLDPALSVAAKQWSLQALCAALHRDRSMAAVLSSA